MPVVMCRWYTKCFCLSLAGVLETVIKQWWFMRQEKIGVQIIIVWKLHTSLVTYYNNKKAERKKGRKKGRKTAVSHER